MAFILQFCSKDVRLPTQMQRAMAAEAEATREARAKVIAAEGEMKASRALKEASDVISNSPAALQVYNYYISYIIQIALDVVLQQFLIYYRYLHYLWM